MNVISVYPASPLSASPLSVHTLQTQDIYQPLTLPFTETPLDEHPKCQSSVIFLLACGISLNEWKIKNPSR